MTKKVQKKVVSIEGSKTFKGTGTVLYSNLAIHAEPSIADVVIGTLNKGDTITIVNRVDKDRFSYVQMQDGRWATARHGNIEYISVVAN